MSNRTKTILSQTVLGLALRIGSVVASFATIPIALRALGETTMGTWLVLLSVFQWITLFDLGIGAGARNEIARAAAIDDHKLMRRAIATGWYYISAVSIGLFSFLGIILLITPIGEWMATHLFAGQSVDIALWIVLGSACIAFVLNFGQIVFAALERPVITSVYAFTSSMLFLSLLGIAVQTGHLGLSTMAALYAISMLMASCVLVLLLWRMHRRLWPSCRFIDRQLRASIVGGGLKLFLIQFCALLIFTTDRILVSAFVGAEAVVTYDAGFRLFALISMTHTLLMNSAWSSFTQAHAKGEWEWMGATMRKLVLLTVPIAVLASAMAWLAKPLVIVWLGPSQVGSAWMYGSFALATVLGCWSNVFSYFLNAIGDTDTQIRTAAIAVILNIPASYFFSVVLGLGAAGVVMGTCCALLVFSVVGPIVCMRRLSEAKH